MPWGDFNFQIKPWLAGVISAGLCLFLYSMDPPWYFNFPFIIILGYLAFPFVWKLFKDKISSYLNDTELSRIKDQGEQTLISLATFQFPIKMAEPARTIVIITIYWMVGETALFGFSIILAILYLLAFLGIKIIHH